MEQKLKVLVPRLNDESVEVDTNNIEVALTKQSLDILSLETRFNPVSSIISLPNSKKNQFIFEQLNDVRERLSGVANKELSASLENQGIKIVDRGRLRIIKGSQEKFEAILTDDGDFVYSAMEALTWEDLWPELFGAAGETFYDFPASGNNFVGRWYDEVIAAMLNLAAGNAATKGFGYGAAKTMSDGRNDYAVGTNTTYPYSLCAPVVFVLDFLSRLETAMNLTFSSPILIDSNFANAVVPLEELKVTERMSEYSKVIYNVTTPKNINASAPIGFVNLNVLYSKYNQVIAVDDGTNTYSFFTALANTEIPVITSQASNKRYGKGTYSIRVKGVGNFTNAALWIYARNGVLSTNGNYDIELFREVVPTNFDVEVQHEFPLLDGATYKLDDYIDFIVFVQGMVGGTQNGVASLELEVKLNEQPIQPYNPVDWAGLIPFDKPIDMFKALQKQYGFTPSWEKYTRTCFLRPFSEVFGIGEDVSDYVDWEKADVSIGWDSLARNNYVQFKDDTAPANIQVVGEALVDEATILEFDFEKTLPSSIGALGYVDVATLEYHKGPFDFPAPKVLGFESGSGSAGTKICLLTSGPQDLTVNFLRLMPLNEAQWGTFNPTAWNGYKVLRTLNINHAQYIKDTYYASLERFYSHPRKVSVPIHLPPEIFRRYDPMKLWFIKRANSYFFVQRISNYLPNKPATAELILLD